MSEIRISCQDHGEVVVHDCDVRALVLKYPGSGIVTQFRFTCPEDKLPAMKNCNQRILGLLTTAGVGIDVIEMPERDTPEQGNKPLTDNDVTDFMFDLHYLPEISS